MHYDYQEKNYHRSRKENYKILSTFKIQKKRITMAGVYTTNFVALEIRAMFMMYA